MNGTGPGRLTVLGSGSKGNAFVLEQGSDLLLIDAGFSHRELERRMAQADLVPGKLTGIAVTHEHGDHASGATRMAARLKVPLIASSGTWSRLRRGGEPCEFRPLDSRATVEVGGFALTACPTSRDATEPLALAITLANGVSVGVAYDLGRPTQALRYFLRNRHCLVLEANHDETLLRTCGYPATVQERIIGPGGHLSNLAAARLLEELHHAALGTVVLAHLSQRANHPERAREVVGASLSAKGFQGRLVVASQDGPMEPLVLAPPAQGGLLDQVR